MMKLWRCVTCRDFACHDENWVSDQVVINEASVLPPLVMLAVRRLIFVFNILHWHPYLLALVLAVADAPRAWIAGVYNDLQCILSKIA